MPSEEQAARFGREHRLALWRCWQGMALKESVVFLGTEDLPFNRRALPANIEHEYLPLYLYTLYQKLQLFDFSCELMHKVAHAGGNVRGVRALLERIITFRSRYWFNEVTRKPQGGELYRTFHQGMEVPALYQMVTGSVKEVKEYYEELRARQVKLVLNLLAVLFGPVAMVFGAVQVFLAGDYPLWAKALLLTTLVAGAGAVLLGVRQARQRSRARRGRRRAPPAPAGQPRVYGAARHGGGERQKRAA
jgi:hypothetical protein